ncbi:uncharacterized protein LOC114292601 [Camellia sinensis]|uniref:uncharacterized protein LOC114292601 n=1 Tax=Camellia sinensis TaxID=4442 RepID=UPI001036E117|nr:uncharacterized protein LOC114292601 [Camellia sinensis]
MGKTAVFVLFTLQQIEPVAGQVAALVMCHTRELAYQICWETWKLVPSDHLQNSGLDTRSSADYAETINNFCPMLEEGTGTVAVSPDLDKENQTQMFENEFGKLLPALCRSRAELSGTSGKGSQAQKMKVKDVSKYVISAAKNPQFAQKLHAVLLESGASQPPDFLLDMNPRDLREMEMHEKIRLLNGEKVGDGTQDYPDIFLLNNKLLIIPSTGVESFNGAHYDSKQKHSVEDLTAERLELGSTVINTTHPLISDATSEGSVLLGMALKLL